LYRYAEDKPSERYIQSAKIADAFEKDYHYKVDEKQKSILLSEEGYEAAEELLQVTDLYDPRFQWWGDWTSWNPVGPIA
jgi:preprotein translocase subunit SecA